MTWIERLQSVFVAAAALAGCAGEGPMTAPPEVVEATAGSEITPLPAQILIVGGVLAAVAVAAGSVD